MKAQATELSIGKKKKHFQDTQKNLPLITLTLILLTTILLYYPFTNPLNIWKGYSSPIPPPSSSSSSSSSSFLSYDGDDIERSIDLKIHKKCNIFSGEWIPNPKAPYYTNTSCWAIHNHQNCMKYGRPDTDFLKWRWKPNDCELPLFNPAQFLELLRGKSLAFVGDSVARNQMQSLICLLSRVEYPTDISDNSDERFKRLLYTNYNFTLANFWAPFLIRTKEADPNGPTHTGLFNLYLDEPNEDWTTEMDDFEYVIISAGHWFFRSSIFYEGGQVVGCHYCLDKNITDLTMYYSYRKAFRTSFEALNGLKSFKGTTFLRTFAPSHFENGEWDKGGNCVRRRPFMSNETRLEGINMELYMIQLEEFSAAEREGRKKGLKYRLLDTTEAMLMRPDGHPSRYGHWPHENVTMYNDCVHWCLPGPIDAWNEIFLEMLKMAGGMTFDREVHTSVRKLRTR